MKHNWPQSIIENARAHSSDDVTELFNTTRQSLGISDKDADALEYVYLPLCTWIQSKRKTRPIVIGINGAQGSGKSTMTTILAALLEYSFQLKVACLSIDDLYLPQHERQQLAENIHPLMITRGVPGSHDVKLGKQLLTTLVAEQSGQVAIPVFDKLLDDRLPQSQWRTQTLPVDVVLFEGWCVGTQALDDKDLISPLNKLEEELDADGTWRTLINNQLKDDYRLLFDSIDYLLFLAVPNMDSIFEWRRQQELLMAQENSTVKSMSDNELRRFIQYFERITKANLASMPSNADLVLRLDTSHKFDSAELHST